MSFISGHDSLMGGTSVLPRPTQRAPLASRRLSNVRRTSLGPAPSITKPAPLASLELIDKENLTAGIKNTKRRATITASAITAPVNVASPVARSPAHGKPKKKRGSQGRRVSFSSEIAIRKLRPESVMDAPYEDSTQVLDLASPNSATAPAAPIASAAPVAALPTAELSVTLSPTPVAVSHISTPTFRALAVDQPAPQPQQQAQLEAPSGGSPSLQELLREDALTIGPADTSCVSMDLTRGDMSRLIAPSPVVEPAAASTLLAASPAIRPAAVPADLSVLASPFRLPRAAPAAFASPRPLEDGPSLADLSLSALNSPPTAQLSQDVAAIAASPAAAAAANKSTLLPPASPGAALAAILPNANASLAEPSMDFTATLQQQLTGGVHMELTRPVGGILTDEAANASLLSANVTSDADRMLSLNSTNASVDVSGGLLNHSVARSPLVPATPASANATQDLTASLSILRSGALGNNSIDGFSGALARAAAAPAAAELEETNATMDLTRAIGGVISAAPAAAVPAPAAANLSINKSNVSIASPSDLMAFGPDGQNTMELSGVLVPRMLDFGGPAATGEISMDLTTAIGGLANQTTSGSIVVDDTAQTMDFTTAVGRVVAAKQTSSLNDTAMPMALTEVMTGHVISALPVAPAENNTAPLHTLLLPTAAIAPYEMVAASPMPVATPGRAANFRQLTLDEFYLRGAARFLPVDPPAVPRFSSGATDPFAAPAPLSEKLFTAAVISNGYAVYEAAAAELAGPVIKAVESGIEEAEADIARVNPPICRELQKGRSEMHTAQQQLKVVRTSARNQACSQWAKWRSAMIESKLSVQLTPIVEALRADAQTLKGRRAILRDMSARLTNERDALIPLAGVSAQSAAHAQSERQLVEQQTLYKQLTSLIGWQLCDINANGITLRWRQSVELTVLGSNGTFSEVSCRVIDGNALMHALVNSARIPALFAAASSRTVASLPSLLQSAAVRLGRAESLLAEIKKVSGRHIAHEAPQEDSLRLIVDFSSSPAGGSTARTRFTVSFQLDAFYPFSEIAFDFCPHFGYVTNADVASIVSSTTSFQRLTRICCDLQGIAQ